MRRKFMQFRYFIFLLFGLFVQVLIFLFETCIQKFFFMNGSFKWLSFTFEADYFSFKSIDFLFENFFLDTTALQLRPEFFFGTLV